MTREELIRNLKYTMKKHKNDHVPTFGTNISLMCEDILDYLEQEPKYRCDKCGERNLEASNYCPNCGAKMIADACNGWKYDGKEWDKEPCDGCCGESYEGRQ